MKVVFRVDASNRIGTGHVMRCLSLAKTLRQAGARCSFAHRMHPGNLADTIRENGFEVLELPAPPEAPGLSGYALWLGTSQERDAEQTLSALGPETVDWVVVDHYGLDATWEKRVATGAGRMLVIDDLNFRPHDCDILMDAYYGPLMKERYASLVPARTTRLLGPDYVLLDPEYRRVADQAAPRKNALTRAFIFYGGADTTGETVKALKAFSAPEFGQVHLDVIVGNSNPFRAEIKKLADGRPLTNLPGPQKSLAPLMSVADLALGAGGVTTWERGILKLPSIVTAIAENQEEISRALSEAGFIRYLGPASTVSENTLYQALLEARSPQTFIPDPLGLAALVDGKGTQRVADALLNAGRPAAPTGNPGKPQTYRFRPVVELDPQSRETLRSIRNLEAVRRHMFSDHEITPSEHLAWIERQKTARNQVFFSVLGEDDRPVGIAGITDIDARHQSAGWTFYLAPESRGGLGSAVTFALIDFAFDRLGLEKLNGEVIEGNPASMKIHEKFLFRDEGFKRSNVSKDGARRGVHQYGLTRADWRAGKAALISANANRSDRFRILIEWEKDPEKGRA